MKLQFDSPAKRWEETLPIGNGRLGAMIWGNLQKEHLGLNEDSLWSGYDHDKNNYEVFQYLEQSRNLVKEGKHVEAEAFIRDHMLAEYNESYLPLGDLFLEFKHGEVVTEYSRRLDITNAVANVSYCVDGVRYTREYFASHPGNAIFIRLTCEQPILNVSVSFDSQIQHELTYTKEGIHVKGKCPEHVDPTYVQNPEPCIQGDKGMEFEAEITIVSTDGTVEQTSKDVTISNGSTLVLAVSAVKPASFDETMDYQQIKEVHTKDYKAIYDKVELDLGEQLEFTTTERLERLRKGEKDPGLYALFFQYGRYLLISSSREGSQPANLQGIWSWELRAPWSSNWTTNINTEMNYWLAQSCNLVECMPPYFEFLKKICENGKKTAKVHYNCRGFVHHHNADYWCSTNPVGLGYGHEKGEDGCVTWSFWPMGGAWLSSELMKHYEYNMDYDFLKETAYPILKEAALFLIDWVFEYEGVYVTCPSTSPENRFMTKDGKSCCVSMSSAMDLELTQEVFLNFKKACEILDIQDEILGDIDERLEHLAPLKIGSRGQLLEWDEEFEESEPGHRHVSHLYGLFPSELFEGKKELVEACRVSIMERLQAGGGSTGWSCAWIINLFAILGDGEQAYEYLQVLLKKATHNNLWGDHPPFQIDANFGGTAGIANMLVQDRNGEVKLLPAIPKEWKSGSVKGLRIKNGKAVDIKWSDGVIESSHIYDVIS